MDHTLIETTLKSWMREGTGLELVQMVNEARGPVDLLGWGVLEFVEVQRIGTDSVRVNKTTNGVITYGGRQATVRVAVESFYQDQAVNALAPLTRLLDRMLWPSLRAILRTANIAYIDQQPISNGDYVVDEHIISRFQFDMRISYPFRSEYVPVEPPPDPSPNIIPPIESIVITSHVEDEGGRELPPPVQFDNEEIDLP